MSCDPQTSSISERDGRTGRCYPRAWDAHERAEVPAQFVQRLGPERRQQLIPYDLFRALADVRELCRHDDPEGPCGQSAQKRGVTFAEHSELVKPWVGDDPLFSYG